MRRYTPTAIAAAFLLTACGTVTSQSTDTINVDGKDYILRTQTIEQGGRSFQQTSAIVHGLPYMCLPDSPGDCRAAVHRGLNNFRRNTF